MNFLVFAVFFRIFLHWKSEFICYTFVYVSIYNITLYLHFSNFYFRDLGYITSENRINIYAIFIERSLSLLNNVGNFGFIVPNSLLMQSSYKKLRKLIITKYNLNILLRLPDNVFKDVKAETLIIVIQKCNFTNIVSTIVYDRNDRINSLVGVEDSFIKYNIDDWKDHELHAFNIFSHPDSSKVINKIDSQLYKIGEICDFSLGITPYDKYKGHSQDQIKNKVFHSDIKESPDYKKLLSGEDICRYVVNWGGKKYIKYGDWLGAPREKRFFTKPRIIIRQIISGNPPRIFAAFTEDELYNTQIAFSILPRNKDISLLYLLGIINSQLINFYHSNKYLDQSKNLFQKILIQNAKQLPIHTIDFTNKTEKAQHDQIVSLVSRMLQLHKDLQTASDFDKKHIQQYIARTDREIDTLVYRLYDLTEEEIKVVEGE